MKEFFEALLGRYGVSALIIALAFAATVWALGHWTAAPGAAVSVVWGLVEYTKVASPGGLSSGNAPTVVVPPVTVASVSQLPNASSRDSINLLKDVSVFDLRAWRPVLAGSSGRVSPANYINYLHLRKNRSVKTYVAHYATTGYAIDLRCITHKFTVVRKAVPEKHVGSQEYAIEIDISQEPEDGGEFLVVIEATYWNGFRDSMKGDASTYTDGDIGPLGELALVVLFPPAKPFKKVGRLDGGSDNSMTPYRGVESFYEDVNRQFLYWSIRQRRPDWHYKLEWTW